MSLSPIDSAITLSPPRNNKKNCLDDASMISKSPSSSSSRGDSVLLSSPSSLHGMSPKRVAFVFDDQSKAQQKQQRQNTSKLPSLCYGNMDFSDRIGRTLSFLLLARLALSFILATMDCEE